MVASSPRTKKQMIYQVDSRCTASGKVIASTKRRACWRYGHINDKPAMNGGHRIGADCRGREHEITFEWSLASEKKRILHDNVEVHYSVGRRGGCLQDGRFQCSWSTREHTFTLVAYAYPPLSKTRATRKQFELFIDGCNFSSLPCIYELGSMQSNETLIYDSRRLRLGSNDSSKTVEGKKRIKYAGSIINRGPSLIFDP